MATYKRYYKNDILLGTGTYKYRPYTVLTPAVALTFNLTGCSTTATSANRLGETTISFTKSAGYNWPTTVQVSDATMVSWDHNTGVLVIEKPTLDTVTITVACTKITYSITENLTNVTKYGTHPTSISQDAVVSLKYRAATHYALPDTITVTGARYEWLKPLKTVNLRVATGNVTVTIVGTPIRYAITENLTNVTATGTHPTSIEYGGSVTLIYAASTNYKLPDTVTVTGATYTWASDTGTLTLTNVTGAVTITIEGVISAQKLDTPQNLTVSGDILTFDAVPNAEQYEVYANGKSIGTYTP